MLKVSHYGVIPFVSNKNVGLAQLVEHWSPKPGVGSSSLSTRAEIEKQPMAGISSYIKASFEELKITYPGHQEPNYNNSLL